MLFLGLDELKRFHVDLTPARQIYFGLSLIWQMGSSVLFDNGWIEGVGWSINRLPHRNYYNEGICKATFDNVETSGYMRLSIEGSSFGNQYNTHICGDKAYPVPYNAVKMKVSAARQSSAQTLMMFGLVTEDCVNSMDTTRGGVLSETLYPTYGTTPATYEIDLPEGIAGHEFVPVINAFGNGDARRLIDIYKVWFESEDGNALNLLAGSNASTGDPQTDADLLNILTGGNNA